MIKEYANKEITVVWKRDLCIHSKNCFHGLKAVFNPAQSPWVKVDAAAADDIAKAIDKCPSGALSYYKAGEEKPEPKKTTIQKGSIIAVKEPKETFVEAGKTYAWCACGRSINQPFCDGTHKKESDLSPKLFKEEAAKSVWLCQCKQTKNPPYCDGSHNRL